MKGRQRYTEEFKVGAARSNHIPSSRFFDEFGIPLGVITKHGIEHR